MKNIYRQWSQTVIIDSQESNTKEPKIKENIANVIFRTARKGARALLREFYLEYYCFVDIYVSMSISL